MPHPSLTACEPHPPYVMSAHIYHTVHCFARIQFSNEFSMSEADAGKSLELLIVEILFFCVFYDEK